MEPGEPAPAEPAPAEVTEPEPVPAEPTTVEVTDEPAPAEPAETAEETPPPPPPEDVTTVYIIQRGDTLSKISKRYNIRIDAIKAKNPQLKGDKVLLGQKIRLPGKVDVGEQTVPEGAFAKPAPKAEPGPYTGPTTDYIVQRGDVLGTIAQKHKCTVKQIKELNGMSNDVVVIGRKLRVPAVDGAPAKAEPAKAEPAKKPEPAPKAEPAKPVEPAPAEPAPVVESAPAEPEPVAEPAPAAPAPAEGKFINHTVEEGDDITGISITYDISPSDIRQLNNLSDDAQLAPGMVLKIPVNESTL